MKILVENWLKVINRLNLTTSDFNIIPSLLVLPPLMNTVCLANEDEADLVFMIILTILISRLLFELCKLYFFNERL